MSLNKAEKAALEAALTAAALRSTSPVAPDVPIPSGGGLSTGFLHAGGGGDYGRVDIACSSSVSHGIGRIDKTTSQSARRLYSTRLLALRALRYEAEQTAAKHLRRIDKMIEEESK